MLTFYSASTRTVNARRGITECMESALGQDVSNCDLVVINASIGHNFQELTDQVTQLAPGARVVGASCCGINMIYFLASGIDIDNDQCIAAIETVFDISEVEALDGRVWLQSEEGQGTTFYFSVPAYPGSHH